MTKNRWIAPVSTFFALIASSGAALAEPKPWQMYYQKPVTPVMEDIVQFHDLLLVIEVAIVALVLLLMIYIMVRFNAKSNPVPSKTTHNTALEIIWTVLPIIILVVIAVPSMKLLFFMDKAQNPDMTLKVTGHQWFWSYEYPDQGDFTFDSNLVADEDLKPGQLRLLAVDNHVVLPADTTVRVLITADDVIHDWAMPEFGIKTDAVPGRINETWLRVPSEHIGTYYGQCSELCGVNHGFMPIVVDIVSKQDFAAWVEKAKKQFARIDNNEPRTELAEAGRAAR